MEAYHVIAGNPLVRFSPQQLIDCSSDAKWGNFGCDGGIVPLAFEYLKVKPLMTYKEYRYENRQGNCRFQRFNTNNNPRAKINEHFIVPRYNIDQFKAALMYGPVVISIATESAIMRHYRGGIIDSKACGDELDHAVVAIGYGVENGREFMIIKNSWGK